MFVEHHLYNVLVAGLDGVQDGVGETHARPSQEELDHGGVLEAHGYHQGCVAVVVLAVAVETRSFLQCGQDDKRTTVDGGRAMNVLTSLLVL